MGRNTKPVQAKVEAKPSVTRVGKSRKVDASTARQLEAHLVEALEQQTATSEILRVISQSPMDVQPVFEAIASAALKLCRASLANVFRFDGDLIHLAVVENANVNPEYSAAIRSVFPRPPGRDTAAGRTVLERNIVAIPDVLEDRDYGIGAQTLIGGFRSVLGVPLMREENVIGAIVVCLLQPGQFPESQVALLKTFADQAVIAIENVRLFNADEGSAGAADGDERDPARDQPIADRCAAGVRHHRGGRIEALRARVQRTSSRSTAS